VRGDRLVGDPGRHLGQVRTGAGFDVKQGAERVDNLGAPVVADGDGDVGPGGAVTSLLLSKLERVRR